MDASIVTEMKLIQEENRCLKKMFVALSMQEELLKEALSRNNKPSQRREMAAETVAHNEAMADLR